MTMTRLARICGSALLLGAFALAGDKKKTPPPEAKALLDGLGIQKEDTSPLYASPAEAKVNEGAVRLAWSTGLVMNTLTRDSTNLPGWVQLKNGERLEGKFSVKAKKNRRKPDSIWTFTEINFQAEASAKRKLAAAEVEDFGYNYKIADYYQQAKRRAGLKNPG